MDNYYQEVDYMLTADPATLALDRFDVSHPGLVQNDTLGPFLARMRREAPVHYCAHSPYGAYWSVTKFKDIAAVSTNHAVFSSDAALGGVTLHDQPKDFHLPMFISMDPPLHTQRRKVISPFTTPENLAKLAGTIRCVAARILDDLPRNETFDWVEHVSIELTIHMLAVLFDVPQADRHKLMRWSQVATSIPGSGVVKNKAQLRTELLECLSYFTDLWNERVNREPRNDLISMMAHADVMREMQPMEYLAHVLLLIVGGNDTTRNSITGGVMFLHQNPEQQRKLHANPALVEGMVPEIIRYQTPATHMRRTALQDIELGGKLIRKGDRVVMWYLSGNRDEEVFEQPEAFIIDRPNARRHLSFGQGIHYCVGNRVAEMQLKILWEEILKRFPAIEVIEPPRRIFSSMLRGFDRMQVRIPG
ncbi:cytochrome P450 [Pseudomonas weihenstephanensis]|nr:cytochrome P450 [Pseudomonas weihenstephanensis]